MAKYRLAEAQDGYWRITEKKEDYVSHNNFETWWDVIVAPTTRSNWIHIQYAELTGIEDEAEREATAELTREWEMRESNE